MVLARVVGLANVFETKESNYLDRDTGSGVQTKNKNFSLFFFLNNNGIAYSEIVISLVLCAVWKVY